MEKDTKETIFSFSVLMIVVAIFVFSAIYACYSIQEMLKDGEEAFRRIMESSR